MISVSLVVHNDENTDTVSYINAARPPGANIMRWLV